MKLQNLKKNNEDFIKTPMKQEKNDEIPSALLGTVIVGDLLDGIFRRAYATIFSNMIDRKLRPYILLTNMQKISDLANYYSLAHDQGEDISSIVVSEEPVFFVV